VEEQQPQLIRVLGLRDLSFFLIAALVNLNSVPVIAGAGVPALLLWTIGFLFFFIPQAVAVLEFSGRSPEEGGIYNWTKASFGHFHGFVSGWCYWINNIFYIPTLLIYIIGFASFIGGASTSFISQDPMMMEIISLIILWIITLLNIRGFSIGKWIQNIGAAGTFVTAAAILTIAVLVLLQRGPSNHFSLSALFPAQTDWQFFSLLSVVCLNFVGLELGAIIGGEIKEPERNIPRAVMIAGISTITLFLIVTSSLLIAIPSGEIGIIEGILQGIEHAASEIGLAWIVIPVGILMIFNAAGNTSAWLSGAARIPFVIGIDRYLPAVIGKIHPKYRTPYAALIVQACASSGIIIFTASGSTVRDMYLILLQTTVILQLVPYLYMFAGLLRIRRSYPHRTGFFRSTFVRTAAGISGAAVTFCGICVSFIPNSSIDDISGYQFKLILGCTAFIVPGLIFYILNAEKLHRTERADQNSPKSSKKQH
jgi:amino acid transporter